VTPVTVMPVTVSAPGTSARTSGAGGPPPDDLLASQRPPRAAGPRRVGVTALAGAVVLAAGLLVAQDVRRPAGVPPPAAAAARGPAGAADDDDGVTATATLGAARTDQRYVQRLTLTVVLEPYDGRGDSGARLLGDEVALVDVRVRGFAVVPDDRRTPIPLGRFGRRNVGRATTVPLAAAVTDCSVSPQARREVDLDLRTGEGPVEVLQAAVQPDLVRALDRVVSRACRRPRG
jgi:hypothetical protein